MIKPIPPHYCNCSYFLVQRRHCKDDRNCRKTIRWKYFAIELPGSLELAAGAKRFIKKDLDVRDIVHGIIFCGIVDSWRNFSL